MAKTYRVNAFVRIGQIAEGAYAEYLTVPHHPSRVILPG